jgi:translation initiation factor 2B subunit (eIF-2B alpha/beta/delta family)
MSFELKIRELISDNYSGSAAILEKIIKSIHTYLNGQDLNTEYLRENLLKVTTHFPDLAVLHHFLQQFFDLLEELELKSLPHQRTVQRIEHFIDDYNHEWNESIGKAAEKMERIIHFQGKRVLLHSNSSTIHVLFEHLANHNIFPSIYQTMSGPVFEGKLQARVLSDLGCKVHFINEAAVGRFISEIDFAVVGADNVFTDGFTNKIGTYPIALVCREAAKPFYVISDSRKRSPIDFSTRTNAIFEPQAPKSELWQNPPAAITPVNYYFEFTPKELVTACFFEDAWWDLTKK